ncbi:MAG: phosphoribosylaminoimidazolesuccinocarboxamide synthase [Clostridiales bacterium]|jgi:phosphoribosylaminoimidazole-succinocarboxamide synthase|nr:phosphoribosylaminoimidazolesuccinocarboxamide synthase [Clostridiales bacterium]
MKLIFSGKTKDVYENENGNITRQLKDSATGRDGVFDPGENAVGLSIDGLGRESLKLSVYFFEMMNANKIPNHYVSSDIAKATMEVLPVIMFGKGVEFVCRRKADGSFLRRYGAYASFGDDLDFLVEVTLKDDERKDPPITKDSLVALGILSAEEYDVCAELTKKITKIISADLQKNGAVLYDIKFEFGKNGNDILLADEISAGSMRVYKDGKMVAPMDLSKLIYET